MSEATAQKPTVFYDGSCPICRKEINSYQSLKGAEDIAWEDVSQAPQGGSVAPDLSRAKAMARFHIRRADGSLVSGGYAFAELWTTLPRLRWLGRMFQVKPLGWMLDQGYSLFLRIRPLLHKVVRPTPQGAAKQQS